MRVRFMANVEDYRPIKFPPPHPWWCTGYTAHDGNPIIVAYADDKEYIFEFWPEATELDIIEDVEEYCFTGRFPEPAWFTENEKTAPQESS